MTVASAVYLSRSPHRRRRRRAFTLIELLVAMSIASIIVVTVFASLKVAFKAKDAAETNLEPTRTASLTFDFLRSDFESALPPTGQFAGGFTGTHSTDERGRDSDVLSFYGAVRGPDSDPGTGEIKKIDIAIYTPDGSTEHLLVRRVTGNLLPAQGYTPPPDEEVLCRSAGGFRVQYFDGTQWLDDWDSTEYENTLPLAVQVTLLLDRPNAPGGTGGNEAVANDANAAPPGTFRFSRLFRLPCATLPSDSTTSGQPSSGGL